MHKDAELLNKIMTYGGKEPIFANAKEHVVAEPEPNSDLKLRVRSRVAITDFNAKSKRHFCAPLGVFGVVVGKTRMGLLVCWDAGVSFAGEGACRTETDWTCSVNLDTLEFAGLVEAP